MKSFLQLLFPKLSVPSGSAIQTKADPDHNPTRAVSEEEFAAPGFSIPEGQELCFAYLYHDGPPPLNLDWTDALRRFTDLDAARSWFNNTYLQGDYREMKIYLRARLTAQEEESLLQKLNAIRHPLIKSRFITRHGL